MKILRIVPAGQSDGIAALMRDNGIRCDEMQPSFLSVFTAMSIASEVDKKAYTIVEVSRIDDAMAAVSARKLAASHFSIVMVAKANSAVPKSIANDVKNGVDGWIFQSERLKALYPEDLKNAAVIMPMAEKKIAHTLPLIEARSLPAHGRLLWMGPLDGNTDRLKAAIEAVDAADGALSLVVCGTGKARHTMPAVRLSRAVNERLGREAIQWRGEEFSLEHEAEQSDGIIQAGLDPSELELSFSQATSSAPERLLEFYQSL